MQSRDGGGMSDPSKCFVGHTRKGKGPGWKLICCALLFLPKIIMDLRRQ